MEFQKYQHLERFGTDEVANIEIGECYVFPKIDGTNASVWLNDGKICAGSRKRELSLESDNAGFYAWAVQQVRLHKYLTENPTHRLFGEWLVPHSLQTYKKDAWRRFYVFDVCVDKAEDEILHDGDSKLKHLHYLEYKPLLEAHNIDYINPIAVIRNGSYEQFVNQLKNNVFMIEDGKGVGEGVVIKNYDYKNKYGRQTWAKIVTSEFKEQHAKVMGAPTVDGKKLIEEEITEKYVTTALIEKELSKIQNEDGWSSRMIPRLLNTVYHSLVTEETWNFVKENKNPTIDFKRLQFFTTNKIKQVKPEIFR